MDSLRNKLKSATMASPTKIEANPVLAKLTSQSLTPLEYKTILERYYGFFRPLEEKFVLNANHATIPSFDQRLRTQRLKSDLHALGASDAEIDALPVCDRLPALDNESELLGVLYVMEGSNLGGMLISKHLKTLPFFSAESGTFFGDDPQAVSARWKSFIEHLESRSTSLDEAATLNSASETFQKLDQWMERSVR